MQRMLPKQDSRPWGVIAVLFFTLALGVVRARGQSASRELNKKQLMAFDALRRGEFGPVTEEELSAARSGQLLPILEERFAHAKDSRLRSELAVALVRSGDPDGAYWKYLADPVQTLVESAPPEPVWCPEPPGACPAEKGRIYAAWAKSHGIAENSPADRAVRMLPTDLAALAATGDPRGIPIYLEALQLPGFQVEAAAAEGLAYADDRDAIPLIAAACSKATPEGALEIAAELNLYDDPQAKSAAAVYLPRSPNPVAVLGEDEEAAAKDLDYEAALPSSLEEVVHARRAEAVPVLEQKFTRVTDSETKAHIASALVRLGAHDPIYWNYIDEQAKAAIESNLPPPMHWDAQGKMMPVSVADLAAWAQAHGTTVEDAEKEQDRIVANVLFLASTGDPRGIPLLREGLRSNNFLIQSFAAKGLAKLQDNDSIPLIIDACNHAPGDVANALARSLLYFKNPGAQDAAEKYISADDLKMLLADGPLAGTDPF